MRNSETKLNNKQQKLNSNDILCAFQMFLFAKLQLHVAFTLLYYINYGQYLIYWDVICT